MKSTQAEPQPILIGRISTNLGAQIYLRHRSNNHGQTVSVLILHLRVSVQDDIRLILITMHTKICVTYLDPSSSIHLISFA